MAVGDKEERVLGDLHLDYEALEHRTSEAPPMPMSPASKGAHHNPTRALIALIGIVLLCGILAELFLHGWINDWIQDRIRAAASQWHPQSNIHPSLDLAALQENWLEQATKAAPWWLLWLPPILGFSLVYFVWLALWKRAKSRATTDTDSVVAGVRVSIGETRCLQEAEPAEGGLLKADDLRAYSHLGCLFYRLEFSMTMLPDPKCSIDRGELNLRLLADSQQVRLPFFVRLHPDQEIVVEKKKLTKGGDGKAAFKIPTVGEVSGGAKAESESELEVEAVTVTSWGSGEQDGGWRFSATASRSIKTNITGLAALVAVPTGRKSRGRFRAAAHLRSVKTTPSRLEPEPEVFIEYEFPPTVEIPSAHLPEYI